ncbi:MAG: hypothetical protein IT328_02490 [Caldilineaceae bacterium]|nr:hypothetical protein [Caldilineaceae bacterium]
MNTATPQRSAPRPIKGSWEDLHAQAQQHARNYNDEAITLYQRVFNGLMALPPAARAAGNKRLYNLMMVAGVELQGYLNLRDRYDDSLAVIDKILSAAEEGDKPQIVELKSEVLLQSDHDAEAIALLRSELEAGDADVAEWGHLIAAYIRLKQPENALQVVDEMSAWIEAQSAAGTLAADEVREAKFYQERLRAAALMEMGRMDDVIAIFNDLYGQGGADAFSPHMLYTRLTQDGKYEEALRYIDRDQARPVRAGFWRGLIHRYMGETSKAERIWEAATKEDIVRGDTASIVEHILTLYYLGDPKGEGLELMLRTQREQQRISWVVFLLTGLGWILRGDYGAAHSNFKLAVAQVKSMGESKTLPHHFWRFLQDLSPADQAAQFAKYFDTRTEALATDEPLGSTPDSASAETAVSGTDQ